MRDISLIDKTFDNTQTHLYHLSIQISLDGLYFSVHRYSQRKICRTEWDIIFF